MGRNSTLELLQELFKEEKNNSRNVYNIDRQERRVQTGPRKQTIEFILSYAKSIETVSVKSNKIIISLN